MEYKYGFGWIVQDCSHCTNCKHLHGWRIKNQRFATICPSLDHYLFDSHACQGRMDIGFGLASGKLDLTQKLAESLYQCTLCGACDVNCKTCAQEMEPGKVMLELREMCVRAGFGLPQHQTFVDSIEKNRNPFSEPHEKRFAWMPHCLPTPRNRTRHGQHPQSRRHQICHLRFQRVLLRKTRPKERVPRRCQKHDGTQH
jgi:Fe-S oxidoreductase